MRKLIWGSLLLFFLISTSLYSGGNQGIRIGVLRIHPNLQLQAGYDSNVYMTNLSNPPGDSFVAPALSLRIELPVLTHSFVFGGGLNYLNYFHETKQNNFAYFFVGDLDFIFVGGLGFELYNKYSFTKEPILGNYVNASGRLPHSSNVLKPIITYKIPSGAIESSLEFSWNVDNFYTQSAYNRSIMGLRLAFVYKFLPKTGFYANLFGKNVSKSQLGVSSFNGGSEVGLRGLITAKLSASAGLGWKYGKYSDGTVESEPIIRLSLKEKFSKLMSLSLSFLRFSEDSVISEFYNVTLVKMALWRALTSTLSTRIGGGWWRVDYFPSGQVDNNYTAEINLNYSPIVLSWLNGSLGYVFHRRDSTDSAFRYTDHKILILVKLSW